MKNKISHIVTQSWQRAKV